MICLLIEFNENEIRMLESVAANLRKVAKFDVNAWHARDNSYGAKGYPIDPWKCLTKRLFIENRSVNFMPHANRYP